MNQARTANNPAPAAGPIPGSEPGRPLLALAPMQDITTLAFWNLQAEFGAPDLHFTPYFRVHATSRLDRSLLASVTQSPHHRRCIAQIIGEDIAALVRTARELHHYPVVAIDLNLGCPAPIVCRKGVGGGLLRNLEQVDRILAALRAAISLPFTVKTRLGFESPGVLDELMDLLNRHGVDLVTVHGRTVKEMYAGTVHYALITRAVQLLRCPVLANGDVITPSQAKNVLAQTGARGLMIGRGAVRNPWIFRQILDRYYQRPLTRPTGRQMLDYLHRLYQDTRPANVTERQHVERLKKYVNFIGPGIEPTGQFLHQIRRVASAKEFWDTCHRWLDNVGFLFEDADE